MYCECGCGQITTQYDRNWFYKGIKKGDYHHFIIGHANHLRRADKAYQWRGGRRNTTDGYVSIYAPGHPKSHHRAVKEHIIIAETALGHYLPRKAVIHHIDGNRTNNVNNNLVVCESNGYHRTLHRREIALKESGNSHWRKCPICKKWDDTVNMKLSDNRGDGRFKHSKCEKSNKTTPIEKIAIESKCESMTAYCGEFRCKQSETDGCPIEQIAEAHDD